MRYGACFASSRVFREWMHAGWVGEAIERRARGYGWWLMADNDVRDDGGLYICIGMASQCEDGVERRAFV